MEPSLSGSSAISQHAEPVVVRHTACMQQQQLHVQPRGHSLSAMDPASQGVDATSGAGAPKHGEGLKRLTAALAKVLSSGLASNYVEGLKPIVHNGELLISTHIKLSSDPQPVFIGRFPSLPAAVAAQTQTSELVSAAPDTNGSAPCCRTQVPQQQHWFSHTPTHYVVHVHRVSVSIACVVKAMCSASYEHLIQIVTDNESIQ